MVKQPKEIKRDAFGVIIFESEDQDCSKRTMINLGVKFDPATGSTTPDESDVIDLVDLIQTYKDQCGVEMAQKLIKTGQALPEDFADDGKHSGDSTLPQFQSPQALANAAVQSQAATKQILDALGLNESAIKLSDDQLTSIVEKVIAEKFPDIYKHPDTPEVKPDAE